MVRHPPHIVGRRLFVRSPPKGRSPFRLLSTMNTINRALPVMRRRRFLVPHLVLAVALCWAVGCARPFRPGGTMIPAPANALAAAPLSGDRIAVLAGGDDSKGVFIVDARSGRVIHS